MTSLGAIELRVDDWMIDACSSCSQKGLGAPSGLAPLTIGPRADSGPVWKGTITVAALAIGTFVLVLILMWILMG